MSDIRTPLAGSSLVPQARQAPARVDAVRAAQRAFFEAALTGSATAPSAVQAAAATAAIRAASPAPQGILRPGSLIDIKV